MKYVTSVLAIDPAPMVWLQEGGDGLRVARWEQGSVTRFTWDVAAALPVIVAASDGERYVYGNELILRDTAGVPTYYHQDGLGSTVLTTDATASVLALRVYDVFGAPRGTRTDFGFTGQQ